MTRDHVWRQVERLLLGATREVLLVAPFIKQETFQAALAAVPDSVGRIHCVTRWSVVEVAAGVSDPEIAELAEADGRVRISLCHNLHAKLYAADARCLVGSANLTGKATGRVPAPNIELLIEAELAHPEVCRVLAAIDEVSVPGTVQLARQIREQADLLRGDEDAPQLLVVGETEAHSRWLPETRNPERLYRVYNGQHGNISSDVLAGVLRDLVHMDIPPGLSEQDFGASVLHRLRSLTEVRTLNESGALNLDDAKRALIADGLHTPDQAQRAVETIAKWLSYFDEVYLVPVGPWEIRQGKEIM
ncbi:phospholipase D family protein [Streptomyces alfalfae]|uniref:phospholipase D family protein n=1 Tax=Streptomyces alfalfae TaxID=1642299 RepID=UPI001BA7A155|nr:phospholipase D family protein [Streptomyces alfalfae]QUI33010.1 phospholipase D family protein [Streptomyces alfalfae]